MGNEIPEWIVKYHKAQYRSSAGRAVAELMELHRKMVARDKALTALLRKVLVFLPTTEPDVKALGELLKEESKPVTQ